MPLFSCKRNEMANGLTGIPTGIFPGSHQDSRRNPSPIILCSVFFSSFPIPHPGGCCFGRRSVFDLASIQLLLPAKENANGRREMSTTDGWSGHKDTCCTYIHAHAAVRDTYTHTHTQEIHITPHHRPTNSRSVWRGLVLYFILVSRLRRSALHLL